MTTAVLILILLPAALILREWLALKRNDSALLRRGLVRRLAYDGATLAALALLFLPKSPTSFSSATEDLSLALVVDVSPSMAVTANGISRLDRARQHMAQLVPHLQGARIAMVAFGGQPVVLSPITRDHRAVRLLIDALEPGLVDTPGSAPEEAVRRAEELLPDSGRRYVLLYSDGERTWPDQPPALPAEVPVITLLPGPGAPAPVPGRHQDRAISHPDRHRLEQIAHLTGGTCLQLTDTASSLEQLPIPELGQSRDPAQGSVWLWLLFGLLVGRSLPWPAPRLAGILACSLALVLNSCSASPNGKDTEELFDQALQQPPSRQSIDRFQRVAQQAEGTLRAIALHNACSDALAVKLPDQAVRMCTQALLAEPGRNETVTNLALALRLSAEQPAGAGPDRTRTGTSNPAGMTAEQARALLQGLQPRPGGRLPPKGRPQPVKLERDW